MLMFYIFSFTNDTESFIIGSKLENRIYVTEKTLNEIISKIPKESSYFYEKTDDIIIDALSYGINKISELRNVVIIDYKMIKAHIM